MDSIIAAKILAMHAVYKEDGMFRLRKIFRWYSTTFHTPLHEVPDLPLEEILQAYFEDRYEGMTPEELEHEIQEAIEPQEEREARERTSSSESEKKSIEDEEFARQVEAEEAAKRTGKHLEGLTTAVQQPESILRPTGPGIAPIPPDIEMRFVSDDELGAIESWDLVPNVPPKK